MPQLPSYTPQVNPSPGPVGALGIQAPNLVEPVARGAGALAKDFAEAQFQTDHMVSEDASNKFREFQIKRIAQLSALQSGDAIKPSEDTGLTPTEQAVQDLKDYQKTLQGTLGGGARNLFKVKTDPYIIHGETQALSHAEQQTKVFRVGTAKGSIVTAQSTAAADPKNDNAFNLAKTDTLTAVEMLHPGASPEELGAAKAEALSSLLYGRVLAVAKQDPFYAKKLLEDNPNVLMGQQNLHAKDLVESEYLGQQATVYLNEIDGSVDAQKRLPETQVFKLIDEKAGGNQHLKDRMRAEYGQRKGALAQDDKHRVQQLGGTVAGIAGTNGYSAALNSSELSSLLTDPSPENRAEGLKWKEHIIAQMRSNEDRATSKPLTPEQQAKVIGYMENPSMPTWDDTTVQGLQREVGVRGVLELQDFAHRVRTTPEKKQQLHEDMDQIKVELSIINNPATGKPFIDPSMKPREVEDVVRPFAYRLKQKQEADKSAWSLDTTRKQIRELASAVPTGDTERTGFLWLNKTPVVQPFVSALGSVQPTDSFTQAFTSEAKRLWDSAPENKGKPFPGVSTLALMRAYGRAKQDGKLDAQGNYVPKTSLTIGGK